MSILTSVSDGLALLVSGAAMATATRALWLASADRRTKPATPASASAATSHPAAEPVPASQAAASARPTTTDRGMRGRGNQTREQVRAFLAERAGSDWSLVQVSQGMGRSSATVSYTLDKLVQAGEVELTSPKPRRYAITPSGTAAHQSQPQQQEQAVQAEQAALPEPTPAEDREATAESQPRPRPRASKPASASTDGTASTGDGTRGRGNQTREQVRAFLAERSDRELSLVEVSNGLGRSSATVSYALGKLVAAGDVELTSPKPRRYRITTAGASAPRQATAPAAAPATPPAADQAEEPSATPTAESGRASKPASTLRSPVGAKARGGGLREEVRAVLASRAGEALSLGEVAGGLGRSTATVSYHLQGLVEAGQARLVDGKPRRYTIAITPTPSVPQAPAPVAAGEPAAVAASGSTGRRGTRSTKATGGRRSTTGRSGNKAGAATGKAAAAGK